MYRGYSFKTDLSRYKQLVFFEKNLIVETYIIGYKKEGETILFLIRADGGVSFAGMVDCFRMDDINKATDILKKENIQELDFICWTHPDLDHSKGLKDIITDYASKKTSIWIPEGIDTREVTCSEEVRELFGYLKQCSIRRDTDLNIYSASDKKDLMYYNSICFQKDINSYPLEMVSYAPSSKIIRKQTYMDKFIKNDRSIFFVLALGDMRIFLTGDIEDASIEKIPESFLGEHVHIIKIPHHGSDGSEKMLELGWDSCDIACSTVYRKGCSNLPSKDIMDRYAENSQYLYCTGNKNKEKEVNGYGIVKIITNILENSFSIEIEGNAESWK